MPDDLGEPILDDTVRAIRNTFKGLTIFNVIVSNHENRNDDVSLDCHSSDCRPRHLRDRIHPLFGGILLRCLCRVARGMEKAIIVLVVVLVAENVIQTLRPEQADQR